MDEEIVEIRGYGASDLESCRTLWFELSESHRILFNDPTIGGANPGAYFDRHLKQAGPSKIWVAEVGGEIVGMVGLVVDPVSDGSSMVIEPVVVKKEFRGKGIGRKLLEYAIEKARRSGANFLSIQPVVRNVRALKTFHEAGFRAIGNIDLVMELKEDRKLAWRPGIEIHGLEFEY